MRGTARRPGAFAAEGMPDGAGAHARHAGSSELAHEAAGPQRVRAREHGLGAPAQGGARWWPAVTCSIAGPPRPRREDWWWSASR